ncbi:telomerase Cajal body protein 1-like [Branchiostoma floridae]|uniref:Telomerase Cajal body protein 1-like n=1 Tax=Branchiostoma floridae TaxID=7739 RepID=A0A9J7N455_BRAFL|nr:telomerase Cajal body protein 1-like [Branchiostoma floridae]
MDPKVPNEESGQPADTVDKAELVPAIDTSADDSCVLLADDSCITVEDSSQSQESSVSDTVLPETPDNIGGQEQGSQEGVGRGESGQGTSQPDPMTDEGKEEHSQVEQAGDSSQVQETSQLSEGGMQVQLSNENQENMEYDYPTPVFDFSKTPVQVTGATTEFGEFSSNFLKGCKWSPDGSCILTNSDDNTLRLFNLPVQLYQGQTEGLTELVS